MKVRLNKISVIGWNEDISSVPDGDTVLVRVLDDTGDRPWLYNTVATNFGGHWVRDNDYLRGTVKMWARIPDEIIPIGTVE